MSGTDPSTPSPGSWSAWPGGIPAGPVGCRSAARRAVRIGWFATMPAGLLIATSARGQRTDLPTVPSDSRDPAARAIVRLRGALDFAAAPALSRVSSCDPAGLAVLIGAQRRARPLGIVVRLVAPSLPVSKRLRLTGLDRQLTICLDLAAALAGERHEPATPAPSPQALAG